MRKLLTSIASLMLLLTLASGLQASAAYSMTSGAPISVVEGTPPGHVAGDADEVPSDGDKATPHHHNTSHNHDLGVPVRSWADLGFVRTKTPLAVTLTAPPVGFAQYRDLRPPIA